LQSESDRRYEEDPKKIKKLVDTLTKELPSHQYLISRKEAKDELGLKAFRNVHNSIKNYSSL
jgi:hypothetical protein